MSVFVKPSPGQGVDANIANLSDPEDSTVEDEEDGEMDESREAADERTIEEIIEADEDHTAFSVTDDEMKLGRVAVEKVRCHHPKWL